MIRYAITDRALFPGNEDERRLSLVRQAERLSRDGVDYLQVREKDLGRPELAHLVQQIVDAAQNTGRMKVLVNSSPSVACQIAQATGAAGVHLPADQWTTQTAIELKGIQVISTGAHTIDQVKAAVHQRVDLILFSPVFGKSVRGDDVLPAVGLHALREAAAAAAGIPLLALGGVTSHNMPSCLDAGATGVAGIRLFLK